MVYDFHEGLAKVQNWKYGFINIKGEVVVPLEWDNSEYFSEGLAVVEKDEKYGYINKAGELVIPLVWNFAFPFIREEQLLLMISKGILINREISYGQEKERRQR